MVDTDVFQKGGFTFHKLADQFVSYDFIVCEIAHFFSSVYDVRTVSHSRPDLI